MVRKMAPPRELYQFAKEVLNSRGYGVQEDERPQALRAAAVLWGEDVVIDKDLSALHADMAARVLLLMLWRIYSNQSPVVMMDRAKNMTMDDWKICDAMELMCHPPAYRKGWKEIKLQYREVTTDGVPLPDRPETPAETDAPPKKKAGGRRGRPPKNATKTPETAPESTGGA